jgi:hypothetical protein
MLTPLLETERAFGYMFTVLQMEFNVSPRIYSMYLTTLQINFDLCIPRNGTARPQSQFPHSCVCERFIYYSHDRSTCFPAAEYAYRSWEYIDRTQKRECKNWDCGRAVPFLGIYASNFRYSISAVHFSYRMDSCEVFGCTVQCTVLMPFVIGIIAGSF